MYINITNYKIYSGSGQESGSGQGSGSESTHNINDNMLNNIYEYDYSQDTYTTTNNRKKILFIFIGVAICFFIIIILYIYDSCYYFKYNYNINCEKIKNISNIKCIYCKIKCINYKNKILPNNIDDSDNDNDCVICLNNNDNKSITLLCNHRFHGKCINQWIQTSIDSNNIIHCPLCRVVI